MARTAPNMETRYAIIIGLIVVVIIGIGVGVLLKWLPTERRFRDIFMERCGKFKHQDECQHIFFAFESAYVGKSRCNVPMTAYDPFMAMVPFDHQCSRIMLWSKTSELVHKYTSKNEDCVTLEDTLLGYILDGLTWCGEKGSQETLTTNCPRRSECVNNSIDSFWDRASLGFAGYACGDVTVMLNGSNEQPFDPESTLARIEVQNLKHPRVKHLTVILVTGHKSHCYSRLRSDLRNQLNQGVKITCQEVSASAIEECSSNTDKGCGARLLMMT